MIVVVDASTLINLANGEVLSKVLLLPGLSFHVSAVVRRESKTIAEAIDVAVAAGRLLLVDDSLISVRQFKRAKSEMGLDDGETECILAAQALGCVVACDDGAARKIICGMLGEERLSGSIGLLRTAIREGIIHKAHALEAYRLMRERGGFLPDLSERDF